MTRGRMNIGTRLKRVVKSKDSFVTGHVNDITPQTAYELMRRQKFDYGRDVAEVYAWDVNYAADATIGNHLNGDGALETGWLELRTAWRSPDLGYNDWINSSYRKIVQHDVLEELTISRCTNRDYWTNFVEVTPDLVWENQIIHIDYGLSYAKSPGTTISSYCLGPVQYYNRRIGRVATAGLR